MVEDKKVKGILKKKGKGQVKTEREIMEEMDYKDRENIIVIESEETEEEKRLREYREKVLAMLPQMGGQNFTSVPQDQNDLDKDFDALMDEEYNDDMIGELDECDV